MGHDASIDSGHTPSGSPTSRLDLVERLRVQIVDTARAHGATRVGLFGSVAAGTDGPDSDVDLWIETEPGVSLFDLMALRAELSQLLGSRVDVLTIGGLGELDREELIARSRVL